MWSQICQLRNLIAKFSKFSNFFKVLIFLWKFSNFLKNFSQNLFSKKNFQINQIFKIFKVAKFSKKFNCKVFKNFLSFSQRRYDFRYELIINTLFPFKFFFSANQPNRLLKYSIANWNFRLLIKIFECLFRRNSRISIFYSLILISNHLINRRTYQIFSFRRAMLFTRLYCWWMNFLLIYGFV